MSEDIIQEKQTTVRQQQVDRGRRYWFVSRLTAFCLIFSGLLALMSGFGWLIVSPMIELYVQGLLHLATVVVMAYITGSVIDYNGGIGNILSSNRRSGEYSYDGEAPRG